MDFIHAIWLGIVQGLTEFLPISSSAHLILVPSWLRWEKLPPDQKMLFDVALNAATCAPIIAYFWRDLLRVAVSVFSSSPEHQVDKRLAWGIVIGCIPAALIGVLFEDPIENIFRERIAWICAALIGMGILMGVADRFGAKRREIASIHFMDALLIGMGQALALVPGFSRSGSTITTGLLLGLTRESAARFSFLMSAPITLGAALWSFRHVFKTSLPHDLLVPLVVGSVVAAVVGWLSIALLLRYLRTNTLMPFVLYRIIVGAAMLTWFLRQG